VARVQNSPIVAITWISIDVRPGDSIAAMATLFSCSRVFVRTRGWQRDSLLRWLDSVPRRGAGRGKAGGCGARAAIGG
jgi:hypothetical protein